MHPTKYSKTIRLPSPVWCYNRCAIEVKHTLTFKHNLKVKIDYFLENVAIIPRCLFCGSEEIDDSKQLKGIINMCNSCALTKAHCKTGVTILYKKRAFKDLASRNSRLSAPRAPKNRGRQNKSTIHMEEISASEDDIHVSPFYVQSASSIGNIPMPHLHIPRVSS